jgi:hypothetical protein
MELRIASGLAKTKRKEYDGSTAVPIYSGLAAKKLLCRVGEFELKMKLVSRLLTSAGLIAIGVAQSFGCGQAATSPEPRQSAYRNREENSAREIPRSTGNRERYDVGRDEARGGHTLSKHVGQTDEQLRERLQRERRISAASTWTDRDTAEEVLGEAFRVERGRIESWIRRGYPRANLALHYEAHRVIGRSLRRSEDQPVDATEAVIVLRADGSDGYYVLTSYPETRE